MLGNYRSRMHNAFLLVCLLLPFSNGCVQKLLDPPDPVAPSWTTQLTVPLMNRTYYFNDLVRKDSAFTTGSGGVLAYRPASLQNDPEPIVIPPLDPISATFVRQLGTIPISSVSIPGINMTFQELTGQSPPGAPWPGAEISSNQNRQVLGDTASYDYLIYEEGQMRLTITNTFPFDITFAPGGIDLVDTTVVPAGVTIGTFPIGVVSKNNGSVSASITLNGKRTASALRMRFRFQTIDLAGKTVTAAQHVTAALAITRNGTGNPTLSEAKMKLANAFYLPVTDIRDSVQKLDDSTYIRTAEFTDGSFDITIENRIPFDVIVGFNLREFRDKATNTRFRLNRAPGTGQPDDSITIAGSAINYRMPVQMRDYRLQALKADRNLPQLIREDTLTNGLHFSLDIKTLVESPTKSVIRKTDSIVVKIQPVVTPYHVDYVRGKIAPNTVPVNKSVDLNLGESKDKFTADGINFDSAQIVLKIFTNSLFPTDLKFDVTAMLNGVAGEKLSTPVGKGRNASPEPGGKFRIFPGDTAKIIFDDANPDATGKTLSQFLSGFKQNGKFAFPDSFIIQGTAVLEPKDAYQNDSVGYVKNNDFVYTSLDFTFPLKIGIMNGSYKDTTSIVESIPDTAQVNLIQEGNIFFDLISTFPVGVEVRSKLLRPDPADSSRASRTAPPVLVLDTLRVDGSQDHSTKSSFTFVSLTGEDAAKISSAAFTAVDIKLGTTLNNGGTPIEFRQQDSIVVRSSANIKFKVDIDRLTDN